MTDLLFSVKIMDTARKLGMAVEFLKDRETVLEKVKTKPSVVIFDLSYQAVDPIGLIRHIKNDPETRRVSTLAFISHVQAEQKLEAQQAGCDMVVARSVFAQSLPDILRRHATIQAGPQG